MAESQGGGQQDVQGAGAQGPQGEVERTSFAEPGKEKDKEKSYCCLQLPKEWFSRKWVWLFSKLHSRQIRG